MRILKFLALKVMEIGVVVGLPILIGCVIHKSLPCFFKSFYDFMTPWTCWLVGMFTIALTLFTLLFAFAIIAVICYPLYLWIRKNWRLSGENYGWWRWWE